MIAVGVRENRVPFGSIGKPSSAPKRQAARVHTFTRARWNGCSAVKRSYKSFDDMLVNSPGPILVDFYATWCGPCHIMADVLEEVAPQVKQHVSVVKINTEKYTNLAARYQIQELPTLILFKNGQVAQRITGVHTGPQLLQILSTHMAASA
eukprot:jgi/Ulvmu1/10840/UM007_0014.1